MNKTAKKLNRLNRWKVLNAMALYLNGLEAFLDEGEANGC